MVQKLGVLAEPAAIVPPVRVTVAPAVFKGAVNVPPQVLLGAVIAAGVNKPGVVGETIRNRGSKGSVKLTLFAAKVLRFLRVMVSKVGSPCRGFVGLYTFWAVNGELIVMLGVLETELVTSCVEVTSP
jgi:hypothetical protein